jgi:hypothetical protein
VAFPGRITLLGFCVRDLVNLLPHAIQGVRQRVRVEYTAMCNRIATAWPDRRRPSVFDDKAKLDGARDPITIPFAAAREIHGLLDAHEQSRAAQMTPAEAMVFAVAAKTAGEKVMPVKAIVAQIETARRFFADIHHFSHEVRSDPPEKEIQAQFGFLESALMALTKPYFSVNGELDAVLRETNESTN